MIQRRNIIRNRLMASVAFSALMAVPAFAQVAPPIWAGPYVGANLGWYQTKVTSNDIDGWWQQGWHASEQNSGVLGGVQAGFNWQLGSIVLGVEGDADFGSASGSRNLTPPFSDQDTPNLKSNIMGLGTVRGRFGWAFQPVPLLVYGTAGVAFGQVKNTMTDVDDRPFTWTSNEFRSGWVVGGGLEYAIAPQWTVKAEGLYVDLGNDVVTGGPLGYHFGFRDTAVIARGGFNFKC